ncbi:MAG: GNAT family N-acetyltransferase [Ruminococcus sp.]|nr:GNAT family N-acetyltransferase [Ruminococcus sp.]
MSGEGEGAIGFADGMKMIFAEKKALGGFGKMKDFVSACFCEGGSIETGMKKAKRKFIRIEVLVVRPEYQRQGFMRKMLDSVYRLADRKDLPIQKPALSASGHEAGQGEKLRREVSYV